MPLPIERQAGGMSRQKQRAFGAAHVFITLRLANPGDDLLIRHISDLRAAMRAVLHHHPMRIEAIAVLPAVLHTLWHLPIQDGHGPNRISMLKAKFSRMMPLPEGRTAEQIRRGGKGIWQRSYWALPVRGSAERDHYRDLIHLSPVHAGLCARAQDWPHSSIHRDIARGLAPPAIETRAPLSASEREPSLVH